MKTPQTIIYAIGDVHGRLDLLMGLYGQIEADAKKRVADHKVLVHLGDYVDRGPASHGVLEAVRAGLAGFETHSLLGNHEQFMIDWMRQPTHERAEIWLANGGIQTLHSFGVDDPLQWRSRVGVDKVREKLGVAGIKWLHSLRYSYRLGGFVFVHAGIVPGVAFEDQEAKDLIWIRDAFLSDHRDHGFRVVHGHTPTDDDWPDVRRNRIGIDTGAVWGGRLTAAILDPAAPDAEPEFLFVE